MQAVLWACALLTCYHPHTTAPFKEKLNKKQKTCVNVPDSRGWIHSTPQTESSEVNTLEKWGQMSHGSVYSCLDKGNWNPITKQYYSFSQYNHQLKQAVARISYWQHAIPLKNDINLWNNETRNNLEELNAAIKQGDIFNAQSCCRLGWRSSGIQLHALDVA